MSVIRRIRKKFEYPKNMREKILQHEDEMLKYYSEIIAEKYGEFFQRNGCSVAVKLIWGNDLKRTFSERRMKFALGYSCDVCCEIQ